MRRVFDLAKVDMNLVGHSHVEDVWQEVLELECYILNDEIKVGMQILDSRDRNDAKSVQQRREDVVPQISQHFASRQPTASLLAKGDVCYDIFARLEQCPQQLILTQSLDERRRLIDQLDDQILVLLLQPLEPFSELACASLSVLCQGIPLFEQAATDVLVGVLPERLHLFIVPCSNGQLLCCL